jgi:hypothetical protein
MKDSPWGIDKLKINKDTALKQREAFDADCRLYALCFNTDAGKKVLELMKAAIEAQPTWNPDMKPEYGYYREGQNDVLRHILNRIKYATQK